MKKPTGGQTFSCDESKHMKWYQLSQLYLSTRENHMIVSLMGEVGGNADWLAFIMYTSEHDEPSCDDIETISDIFAR